MTRNPIRRWLQFHFSRLVHIHVSVASIGRTVFFSLIAAALLAQTVGCANKPKSLPADSLSAEVRNSVQSLGILAVGLEPDVSVNAPTSERLARRELRHINPFDPFHLILAPFVAIAGAAHAAPKEQAIAASAAIETAVIDMRPTEFIARRLEKLFERRVWVPIILLYGSEIPRQDAGVDYQKLSDFAIDAALEIRSAFISLTSGGTAHPPFPYATGIHIMVETRLVQVPGGIVLGDRKFYHANYCNRPGCTDLQRKDIPRDHSFFGLVADDATVLREFLDRAFRELSGEIFSFYKSEIKEKKYYRPYYRSRH